MTSTRQERPTRPAVRSIRRRSSTCAKAAGFCGGAIGMVPKCARCDVTYWVCEAHSRVPSDFGLPRVPANAEHRGCRVLTAIDPTHRRCRRGSRSRWTKRSLGDRRRSSGSTSIKSAARGLTARSLPRARSRCPSARALAATAFARRRRRAHAIEDDRPRLEQREHSNDCERGEGHEHHSSHVGCSAMSAMPLLSVRQVVCMTWTPPQQPIKPVG